MNVELILLFVSVLGALSVKVKKPSSAKLSELNYDEEPEVIKDIDYDDSLFTNDEDSGSNPKKITDKNGKSDNIKIKKVETDGQSKTLTETSDLTVMFDEFFLQAHRSVQMLKDEKLTLRYAKLESEYMTPKFLKKLNQETNEKKLEVFENILPLAIKILKTNNRKKEENDFAYRAVNTAAQPDPISFQAYGALSNYPSGHPIKYQTNYPNFSTKGLDTNVNFMQPPTSNTMGSYFMFDPRQNKRVFRKSNLDAEKRKIKQLDEEINKMTKKTLKIAKLVGSMERTATETVNNSEQTKIPLTKCP